MKKYFKPRDGKPVHKTEDVECLQKMLTELRGDKVVATIYSSTTGNWRYVIVSQSQIAKRRITGLGHIYFKEDLLNRIKELKEKTQS